MEDEVVLSLEFGESLSHLSCEHGDELIDERFLLSEERVSVTNGTAKDAADDVTCLGIGRKLSVSDRESHSAEVVSAYTHSHVSLLVYAILQTGDVLLLLDDGLEDVGIVVRVLALHGANKTLEAHTCIDNVHWKRNERAVGLALVLHEHDVPDLDNLGIVLVYEFASGSLSLLLGSTRVEVNLRAGTTRTRIAHLPEVVVLVAVDDMVSRNMLCPI